MNDAKSPTEWFDQFPPPDADWAHGQWCWRHWAPCPILGANGIGASTELMHAIVEEIASPGAAAQHLNQRMAALGRLCCHLGDDRMYEIWSHWRPAGASS